MTIKVSKEYIKERQYKIPKYLKARIDLHNKFSNYSFHSWVWDKLNIRKAKRILEVGCGTGQFWVENYPKLPNGCVLTLTDFSENMVGETKRNVKGDNIIVELADIEDLPYSDDYFDFVLAHHIVYHAKNIDKALSELKRVIKPNGFISITTNSEKHMEKIFNLGKKLDKNFPQDRPIDSFTEEIADKMLPKYFLVVKKFISTDELRITDENMVIDYVKSEIEPRKPNLCKDFYHNYRLSVYAEMRYKGYFSLNKRSPLYICSKVNQNIKSRC